MKDRFWAALNGLLGCLTKSRKSRILTAVIACLAISGLIAGIGLGVDAKNGRLAAENGAALLSGYQAAYADMQAYTGGNTLGREAALPVGNSAVIGTLELPTLGLTLAVQKNATEELIKNGPCLAGELYPWQEGCVIVGEGYAAVFKNLKKLQTGDAVTFTDITGKAYAFTVCAPGEAAALTLTDGRREVGLK